MSRVKAPDLKPEEEEVTRVALSAEEKQESKPRGAARGVGPKVATVSSAKRTKAAFRRVRSSHKSMKAWAREHKAEPHVAGWLKQKGIT